MVDVVETYRKVTVAGDLKFIHIVSDAACDTSHTIDLNSDIADGKGLAMTRILNTLIQDDAGADVTSTWDPDTGIITMGSITTGIHHILIVGY